MERFVAKGYEIRYGIKDHDGAPAVVAEGVHIESGVVASTIAFRDAAGLAQARKMAEALFARAINGPDLYDLFRMYAEASTRTATIGPPVNVILGEVAKRFGYDVVFFPGIGMHVTAGVVKALGVLRWISEGATPTEVERRVLDVLGADAAPILAPGASVSISPVKEKMDLRYATTPLTFRVSRSQHDVTGVKTLSLGPIEFAWWDLQPQSAGNRSIPQVPQRVSEWVSLFPFDPLVVEHGKSKIKVNAAFLLGSRLVNMVGSAGWSVEAAAKWVVDLVSNAHYTASSARLYSGYLKRDVPVFMPSPGDPQTIEVDITLQDKQSFNEYVASISASAPVMLNDRDLVYAMKMEYPLATGALAPVAGVADRGAAPSVDYGFTATPVGVIDPGVMRDLSDGYLGGSSGLSLVRLVDGRLAIATQFSVQKFSLLKGDVVKNADMLEAFKQASNDRPTELPVAFLQAQDIAQGRWMRDAAVKALDGVEPPIVVGSVVGREPLLRAFCLEPMIFRPGDDVYGLRESLTLSGHKGDVLIFGAANGRASTTETLSAQDVDFGIGGSGSSFHLRGKPTSAEFSLVPLLREHASEPIPLRVPDAKNPGMPVNAIPYGKGSHLFAISVNNNYVVILPRLSPAIVERTIAQLPGLTGSELANKAKGWFSGSFSKSEQELDKTMIGFRDGVVLGRDYPACPIGVYRQSDASSVVLRVTEPDEEKLIAVDGAQFARALLLCGGAPRATISPLQDNNVLLTLWDRVGDHEAPIEIAALSIVALPQGLSVQSAPGCLLGALRNFRIDDLEREARSAGKSAETKIRETGYGFSADSAQGESPDFKLMRAPLLAHLKRLAALWKSRVGDPDSASVTFAASRNPGTVAVSFGARTAGVRAVFSSDIAERGVVRVGLRNLVEILSDEKANVVRLEATKQGTTSVLRVTGSRVGYIPSGEGSIRDGNLRDAFAVGRMDLLTSMGAPAKAALSKAIEDMSSMMSDDTTRPHLSGIVMARGNEKLGEGRYGSMDALGFHVTNGHLQGSAMVRHGDIDLKGDTPFAAFISGDFVPSLVAFLGSAETRGAVVSAWTTLEYDSVDAYLRGDKKPSNGYAPLLYWYGNDGSFAWDARGFVTAYPALAQITDGWTYDKPLASVIFAAGASARIGAIASVMKWIDGAVVRMADERTRRVGFFLAQDEVNEALKKGSDVTIKRAKAKIEANSDASMMVVDGKCTEREITAFGAQWNYLASAFAACEVESRGAVLEQYGGELDPFAVRSEDRSVRVVIMPRRI